jgi:hypothetical protein
MANEEETRTEGQYSNGREERRRGAAEGGVHPTTTDADGTSVHADD